MTDYSWCVRGVKHRVGATSGMTLFVLLIGVVLSLVAVRGIVGTKKDVNDGRTSKWDGVSSFVLAINGKKDYLAILQKDPKRAVLFALGDLVPGDASSEDVIKVISARSGIAVGSYLNNSDGENELSKFGQFTSYLTPVKIALGGWDHANNNITRIDAIRLWWQTKSIRVNEVSEIDVSGNESLADKRLVLGTTTAETNRIVTPYVENLKILNEDLEINIVNASDDARVPVLVETFVSSVGGRVTSIVGSSDNIDKCMVTGHKSYTRDYLAKTFDCDIKDEVLAESGSTLTFVVGREFAKTYF